MKNKNYWFVIGAHSKGLPYHPMVTGYDNDGTLYFGHETSLFTTYARARSAMNKTLRRSPDLLMEVRRGKVQP